MDLLSLLPPPPQAEETRLFTIPGSATTIEIAFRIVPGIAHELRVEELESRLFAKHGEGGLPISLPQQPPCYLTEQMCNYFALLMACQCAPSAPLVSQNGAMVDVVGLEWKPWDAAQWFTLASRAESVFGAAIAFIRVLEARAEGRKVTRVQIAAAYQLPPPKTGTGDLVSATRAGYDEEPSPEPGPDQGNALSAQGDSAAPVVAS